jgi:hypothetical protein
MRREARRKGRETGTEIDGEEREKSRVLRLASVSRILLLFADPSLSPLRASFSSFTTTTAGDDKDLAKNMARFAFCKEDASIVEAAKRLRVLRKFAINPALLPPLKDGSEGGAGAAAGAGGGGGGGDAGST